MHVCFGKNEFGEVFHAAAFLAISDPHQVTIVPQKGEEAKWQLACEFLNQISPNSTKIAERTTERNIGCTADVFLDRQHDNLPKIVTSKLGPLLDPVPEIVERAKSFLTQERSCFLWVRRRRDNYKSERNLTELAYHQLTCVLQEAGIRPILIGDKAPFLKDNDSNPNLLNFFEEPLFHRNPLLQLQLLNYVCDHAKIAFSIGMMSGAMDGIAFCRGLRTYYVSRLKDNGRMDKVGKAFPAFSLLPVNYEEKLLQFSTSELEYIYSQISK